MTTTKYLKIVLVAVIAITVIGSFSFLGCKASGTTVSETTTAATSAVTVETTAIETTAAETKAQPVKLTFWWWGEQTAPGMTDVIDKVITDYEKIHPNVTIDAVLQGTDETIPAFTAAAEAGSGPDIATLWYGLYMYEQVWKGYAVPISDYISGDEINHWKEKKFVEYDGKIWGVNNYTSAEGMAYNKELFTKVGLDPDDPQIKNWDDFLKACDKFKKAGIIPYGLGVADGWMVISFLDTITYQLASIDELKQAVIGERSFEEEVFTAGFTRFKELLDKGYLNKDSTSLTTFDRKQNFYQGKYAMTFEGEVAGLFQTNKELGTDKFEFLDTPQIGDKPFDYMVATGNTNFITSWSKNKEVAADFLAFFHNKDIQQFIYDRFEGAVMPFDDRFDFSQVDNPAIKNLYNKMTNSYDNNIFVADYYLPWSILEAYIAQGQLLLSGQNISPADIGKAIEKAASTWREQNPDMVEAYKKW
ncbi:MAG: extracellular solute-binding protein [Actinobacteria bacterium]|nr:extracellular solute-binding protein [Actinomycetota bacterium]